MLVCSERIDEEVIAQSYARYANAYVRKPSDQSEFVDTLRAIEAVWFDTIWLPPRDGTGAKDQLGRDGPMSPEYKTLSVICWISKSWPICR